jgi:hypothetical protein
MWILKGTCHYGGHPWKDGHKPGQTVFVYSTTLPKPYAPGQHPRVGNLNWSATAEHFTFRRASVMQVIRLIPTISRDMKNDWRTALGRQST